MNDLAAKVAFLEARLTLLERQFSRSSDVPEVVPQKPPGPTIFSCDTPGLLISRMYSPEKDENGRRFCWVGNEGDIQIVLPVNLAHPLTCTLHLRPHSSVAFEKLVVIVNEQKRAIAQAKAEGKIVDVSFKMPADGGNTLNILLSGLTSVRPSDIGENADTRLLAARFFGATITYH